VLICARLFKSFPNTFWEHGIWYTKYQILLNNSKDDGRPRWWLEVLDETLKKFKFRLDGTVASVACAYCKYRVAQKSKPQSFVHIFVPNIYRFSNFFHWCILWKICSKVVTRHTTTP